MPSPVPLYLPANVLDVLGRLASEPYQRRWIVNGGDDGYILASDLLEEVCRVSRWAATAPTSNQILRIVHTFLVEYYAAMEEMPEAIDVDSTPAWLRVRSAAAVALRELGHAVPDDVP